MAALPITEPLETTVLGDALDRFGVGLLVLALGDAVDDSSFTIAYVNEQAAKSVGAARSELEGNRFDAMFPEVRRLNLPAVYARVVTTGQPVDLGVVSYADNLHPEHQYSIYAFPMGDRFCAVVFENLSLALRLRASLELAVIQERERRHLGRELHDQIGQMLTGLKLMMETSRRSGSAEALGEAEGIVIDILERVRSLSLHLRPPMLDEKGLAAALAWHVDRFRNRTGLLVELQCAELPAIGAETETVAFRIAQEALTNIARHAHARRVSVSLDSDGSVLRLKIVDDGSGFDTDAATATSGLSGMRERAAMLGGEVAIFSKRGKGTTVQAELPVRAKAISR